MPAHRSGYGLVQVSVGIELVPLQFPLTPNVVDAPAPSEPLWDTLRTVCDAPLAVSDPFHIWVIV